MIQDIRDRIPTNVLSNDAIRYGIYDGNGNLLRYEYIKREDEPIEEGTPVNRGMLANIQGDLYTSDRYSTASVQKAPFETGVFTDNRFFADMVEVDDLTCENDNVKVTISDSSSSTYKPTKLFDGNWSNEWRSNSSATQHWIKLEFYGAVKITKIKTRLRYYDSAFQNMVVQGSNDDSSWDDLNTSIPEFEVDTEITIANANFYKYYRINFNLSSTSYVYVYELELTEVEGSLYGYLINLSLPLASYETGKIVNIEGGIGYTSTPTKLTTGKYIPVMSSESQDGFEIGCLYNDNTGVQNIWDAFDDNTDTSYGVYNATSANPYPLIYVKLDQPRIVTGITAKSFKESHIMGSNDGVTWSRISTTSYDFLGTEVTFENTTAFLYYGIQVYRNSSGYLGSGTVYEFQITSWYEDELTEVKTFTNPYLNINNLGAKLINGTIKAGQKYSLIYNGESFDIISPFVSGVLSGKSFSSGDTFSIDLGTEYRYVLLQVLASSGADFALLENGASKGQYLEYDGASKHLNVNLVGTQLKFTATGLTSSLGEFRYLGII